MAEEKESTSIPLSQAENGGEDPEDPVKSPPTSSASSTRQVHYFSFHLHRPFFKFNLIRLDILRSICV